MQLKTQVSSLITDLQKSRLEKFNHGDTLLLGDSTIGDIDAGKLIDTIVTLSPSVKIEDLAKKIDETSDKYSRIIICPGNHDCASDSIDHESLASSY